MTTPVTTTGQLVARVNDLSGNGHNAYQGTQAYTPTYQKTTSGIPYLKYDLSDDYYNVDFPNGLTNAHYFFATPNGVVHGKITVPAGTWQHPTNPSYLPDNGREMGMLVYDGSLTQAQIDNIKNYFIDRGSQGNFAGVTNMSRWFLGRSDLIEIDANSWDVSSVTNFGNHTTFNGFIRDCRNLKVLYASNWITSSVKSLGNFAFGCASLTTLDVSNWNVSGVTDFGNFVNGCGRLSLLDVSNWNTSSATHFSSFAFGCASLTTLNLSNWVTSNVNNFYRFATHCHSLTNVIVNGGAGNPFADSPCTNYIDAFTGTNLTQASIDNILTAINTANTSNGNFHQTGGSAPTVTNQINGMLSRGWTVNVTGGYDPTVTLVDAASQTLMGTFTRSSTATYFDSTGTLQTAAADTPRWDYDPSTGTLKGLLIEGSRTNLLTYSNDFSQWVESTGAGSTSANVTGPDGVTNSATTMTCDGTNYSRIHTSSTITANSSTYIFSIYVQKTTSASYFPLIEIGFSGGTHQINQYISFNTNNGTLIKASGTSQFIKSEDVGSFWRVTISNTNNGTNTNFFVSFYPYRSDSTGTITNPAGSNVIYGAQLEQASFPSSYIPTNGSAVTRAAEKTYLSSNSITNIDPNTGSFIAKAISPLYNGATILGIGGSTISILSINSSGIGYGSHLFYQTSNSITPNTFFKIGAKYTVGDQYLSLNGGDLAGTKDHNNDISTFLSSGTNFRIGYLPSYGGYNYLFGHINTLKYYPYAMTNQTLQKNTT